MMACHSILTNGSSTRICVHSSVEYAKGTHFTVHGTSTTDQLLDAFQALKKESRAMPSPPPPPPNLSKISTDNNGAWEAE